MQILLIASVMIACWMLGILHPAIVGFVGCFLLLVLGGLEFDEAFKGFTTEVPWFFYGTLLIAIAADRSGMIGAVRDASPRSLRGSTMAAASAIVVLAYMLAYFVPSSLARAALLLILAQAWGPSPWLAVAAGYSAAAFGHPDMPGGLLAIRGWDAGVAVAIIGGIALGSRWFPSSESMRAESADVAASRWTLAMPVAIATVLWLTTSLHGTSPALVGLACGLMCLVPGIAPPGKHPLEANHLAVVFVGTAISIPMILEDTKAVELMTHTWSTSVGSMGAVAGYWSAVVYRLFGPDGARPGLPSLAPALGSAAIWSYAGTTFVSLHQSPALILAYAVGGCGPKQILTVGGLALIVGSIVVLVF